MIKAALTKDGHGQSNLEEIATRPFEYHGFGRRMSTSLKQALPGVPWSQFWEAALQGVIVQTPTSGDCGVQSSLCSSVQKEVKQQSQCPGCY